jgi:hypothetical protein
VKLILDKSKKLECLSIIKDILDSSEKLSLSRYYVIKHCYQTLLLNTIIKQCYQTESSKEKNDYGYT